jgi:hypothetical protein
MGTSVVRAGRFEKLTIALAGVLLLAVLLACKGGSKSSSSGAGTEEPATAISTTKKDYVGDWTAPGITLSISPTGTVAYEKKTGSTSKKVNGPIKTFHGDNIDVFALITVTLEVQRAPHEDGGVWKMTVENDELTRSGSGSKRGEKLEKLIQTDLAKKGVVVKSVTCPSEAETSKAFDCDVTTGDNSKMPMHVTVAADVATWKADVAVLDPKKIEQFIEETFEKQMKKKVDARCAPGLLLKKPGETFTCQAVDKAKPGSKPMQVTVTAKDVEGNIGIDYKP